MKKARSAATAGRYPWPNLPAQCTPFKQNSVRVEEVEAKENALHACAPAYCISSAGARRINVQYSNRLPQGLLIN